MLRGITPSTDLKSEMSDVFVVSVCRSMGWTYEQYANAPQWFVDVLEGMISAEKELKKEKNGIM